MPYQQAQQALQAQQQQPDPQQLAPAADAQRNQISSALMNIARPPPQVPPPQMPPPRQQMQMPQMPPPGAPPQGMPPPGVAPQNLPLSPGVPPQHPKTWPRKACPPCSPLRPPPEHLPRACLWGHLLHRRGTRPGSAHGLPTMIPRRSHTPRSDPYRPGRDVDQRRDGDRQLQPEQRQPDHAQWVAELQSDRQLRVDGSGHRQLVQHPAVHSDPDAVAAGPGDPKPDPGRAVQHGRHGQCPVGQDRGPALDRHEHQLQHAGLSGGQSRPATLSARDRSAQMAQQHYADYGINEGRTGWQAPTGGNAQNILNVPHAATSFDSGGPIQKQLGPSGPISQTYGTDFSADRQRVEDSLMQRMNPQLAIEKQGIQQQLADQGIRYGSQAYADAMDNYSRQANDARYGAIQNAGAEQQRMVQEEAQRAAFQNPPSSRATSRTSAPAPSRTRRRRSSSSKTPRRARSTIPAWRSNSPSSSPASTRSKPRSTSICNSSSRSATSRSTRSPR
jgi:hypothetical protein